MPSVSLTHLDELWFQVSGTHCNLTCDHCFISCSPHNRSFGYLSLSDVQSSIAQATQEGVREFYFTGGEPFLNPEMVDILCWTLQHGPATVLTNGTVLKEEWLAKLQEAERQSRYSLEFRLSIDGFSPETNDPIRGDGTFDRAMAGVSLLCEFGFLPIITATRVWDEESDLEVLAQFKTVLKAHGYSRPRIKLLPTLQIGAEENRTRGYLQHEVVTDTMLSDFDQHNLVCSHSRIVTDRGVHVCPILIESPDSNLGQSISESLVPFEIKHGACYTCYQYGSICTNASSGNTLSTTEPTVNPPDTAREDGDT